MDFPKTLRMWRESLDLTLREVGEAAGRTKQAAKQWELGIRIPSPEDVAAIATLFAAAIPRKLVAPPQRKPGRPRTRPLKPGAGARA